MTDNNVLTLSQPSTFSDPLTEVLIPIRYLEGVSTGDFNEALLAFYDFPAAHWTHPRTSNPIESTFATVRHRTVRSTGCLSNRTALAMVFKLAQAAEKSWRRLAGHNRLPKLIQGVEFTNGIEAVRQQPRAADRTPPSPRFG